MADNQITTEYRVKERIKAREIFGYGFGDLANNIVYGLVTSFATYYYTNSAGMAAAAVGTMFLISRVFDGISDVIMGFIIDRTKTKYGKARPWILWMAIPFAIAVVLQFSVPQSFSTDDQIQMTDEDEIVGMMSSVVAGHYKMFIGRKKLLDNIDQIFNALQLANHKVFTPVAVGDVILSSDEKDSGVALVDMGAGVTSVSVYMGGILRHYASIPFGGATVTSDIRLESGFSERLSENLKLAYGACIPEKLVTLSDKIIRVNYPENGNFRDIKVQYLSRIIAEREKEIIQAVLWEIQQSGYADELRSGVVLTGGAAEMTNLSSLMSSISGYNVRIGYPRKYFNCTGFPEAREASAEVILGLIMAGKTQEMLNCVGRIDRPAVEPDTHDEEEAAEEPQAGGDKLFSDEEMDKMVEKPEKKKKPEKVKKNRPRPVWITKISDFVENASELFDGAD